MLFRQDPGGSHQRRLEAGLDNGQHRQQGDDGLSGSYVALQQTVHRAGLQEIRNDFPEHLALRGCQSIRENRLQFPAEGRRGSVNPSSFLGPTFLFLQGQTQLKEEHLLEEYPSMRRRCTLLVRFQIGVDRKMNPAKRLPAVQQAMTLGDGRGERIGDPGRQFGDHLMKDLPEQAGVQGIDARVDRNHPAGVNAFRIFLRKDLITGVFEHQLAGPAATDPRLPVESSQTPLPEHIAEVCLVVPEGRHLPAGVLQQRLHDDETPPPGMDQPGFANPGLDGDPLPRHQAGDLREPTAVLVAKRQMAQEILDRVDPRPVQKGGPGRADTAYVPARSVQIQGHGESPCFILLHPEPIPPSVGF